MCVQTAHSFGYVTVNMDKVEKDVMGYLDANGDGNVDEKDAQEMIQKTMNMLTCDTGISAGRGSPNFRVFVSLRVILART